MDLLFLLCKTSAKLLGITIDKNDVIYITDRNNHNIRRIHLNPNSDPTVADNWTVETIAGGWNTNSRTYGNNTGSTDNVSGDTALFNYPTDITTNYKKKLYDNKLKGFILKDNALFY
jgi:hypothetical protein